MIKQILCLLLAVFLFTVVSAEAQQQAKVSKIGWLGARPAASGTGLERLRQELRAIGHVEGKNIVFEARYADNKLDRLPTLADKPSHQMTVLSTE